MSQEHEVYNYDTGQWETVNDGWTPSDPSEQWPGDPYSPIGEPVGPPEQQAIDPTGPFVIPPDIYDKTPPPTPPPVLPPGGRSGSGGWGYLTEPFTGRAPSWNMWSPTPAPEIVRPPDFSYKQFEAPTTDSVYADPSYQFRKGEGEKALSNRIASTGAYRTGGTLKDFINYNQNAASQEYANIFDRAVTSHNLGLQQALGTYGTNWGVSRDILDNQTDQWKATNTWGQRENENVNNRNMDQFLSDFDIFTSNRKRAGDYLLAGASLGG